MSAVCRGRCLCGAVTYECGPPVLTPCFCHCESCRRASGAHAVAWATVARESFRILSGPVGEYASSAPVLRQFCQQCGSQLTYRNESWPDTIDIAITTLEQPDAMRPAEHIWMEDALSWDRPADGLPQFPRGR